MYSATTTFLSRNPIRKRLILSHFLGVWCVVLCLVGLESCANSFQIVADRGTELKDVGLIGGGTAYVNVDVSGVEGVKRNEAASVNTALSSSIAHALGSSFRQTRSVPDLSRLEPDSADLVVFVRALNPTYPKLWGDLSRSWLRLLLVGILAEAYNIFALDFSAYRNIVVLPFAALALPLYNFFYCYQYESTNGSYTLNYQLFVLKPDGSLINRRQFTDSAKVLVQADTKIRDLGIEDFINSTASGVSCSVQNYVIADSTTIRNLGEEMKRTYPADCDRILTYKRNVYRVLDDSASQVR